MKNPRILTGLLALFPLWLTCQTFQFNPLNTHFVLIPGGGFETKAWIEVPPGDTVQLDAEAGPGMHALFQPANVTHNQFVHLVVISTDSILAPQQSIRLIARHLSDSIVHLITVDNHYNGHGFHLIDSARYYQDTVFRYLIQTYGASAGLLDSLRHLDWIPSFPYPPLLVVTHHLFVRDNWRTTVLWHNMIPPHNWVKVFVYNEAENVYFGVMIDTWGSFSIIPCEMMHYTFQDTITYHRTYRSMTGFTLYPNPTRDFIHISAAEPLPGEAKVSLFTLSGVRLMELDWLDHKRGSTYSLVTVPAGVYILGITYEDGQWQQVIIKH